MNITHRIYSDELATFAPEDIDVHRWARDTYADTLRKELEARWQEAEVEVDVIPRTSGYGSGPTVTDEEGLPLDDVAIEVREISDRVLERLSQAPAGQTHVNLGQTGIGAPGATDAEDLAESIMAAADEDGTLQAEDMLEIAPGADPRLHTTMHMTAAADALGCRAELDELAD